MFLGRRFLSSFFQKVRLPKFSSLLISSDEYILLVFGPRFIPELSYLGLLSLKLFFIFGNSGDVEKLVPLFLSRPPVWIARLSECDSISYAMESPGFPIVLPTQVKAPAYHTRESRQVVQAAEQNRVTADWK